MPKISKIKDSIVTIKGNDKYKKDERFQLSKDAFGIVLSATEQEAQLLIVGDPSDIKVNTVVKRLKDDSLIHVYDNFFGNIITPFGEIIHSTGKVKAGKSIGSSTRLNHSPSIMQRTALNAPLSTGILTIDTMIPIGKGQRELIIGDRNTGKTSIALSTMINQKNDNVKSIYVSIGQKRNSIISLYNTLKEKGALESTIIIFANPDSASEKFLAPTIGMAMAEAIAYQGEDVLIVIDDLTKHANVYREISLSIGKNPGREAYPTDIFYQHSSLLERAGKFTKEFKNGSITCLPIVETVEGDLASLIPSNIISITDGQIFTDTDSFNSGIFPAINIQLSVSRTGSAVQSKLIKKIAKGLKAQHAVLYEIKKFADLSIDISDSLVHKINKLDGMNTLLVQYGFDGYSPEQISVLIIMFELGYLNNLKDKKRDFNKIFNYICNNDPAAKAILEKISSPKFKPDDKQLIADIEFLFGSIVKALNNENIGWISQKDLMSLKGVTNG